MPRIVSLFFIQEFIFIFTNRLKHSSFFLYGDQPLEWTDISPSEVKDSHSETVVHEFVTAASNIMQELSQLSPEQKQLIQDKAREILQKF